MKFNPARWWHDRRRQPEPVEDEPEARPGTPLGELFARSFDGLGRFLTGRGRKATLRAQRAHR